MADTIAYEKFLPVAPLAGASIAIFFDVGYFYGVGIDYFTLFSLTEHIGFALEALPAALIISIFGIFLDALVEAPTNWSRIRATVKGEYNFPKKKLSSQLRTVIWGMAIFALLSAASLAYLWHLGFLRIFVLEFVFVMMVATTMSAGDRWYSSRPIFLLVIGCTAALLLGEFFGSRYVASPMAHDTIAFKSGDPIAASVIRAGERGVLYAKPQPNVVEFSQWDTIKSISRNSEKSFFNWEKK
jgi:hypothetical protein